MEFRLLEHCQLCQSKKKTDRKKGVSGLMELLSEESAVQVLNRNSLTDQVNWTELFKCAHQALLLESESWKADEPNKSASSLVISNRENAKRLYSSVADVVLQKANALRPSVDFSEILEACFRVFSDRYLMKICGEIYLSIMHKNVLPVRKYRNYLQSNDWDKLFHHVLSFMNLEKELKGGFFYQAIELMNSVITYCSQQSHLCLQVKGKLLPLLEVKFVNFYENVSLQEVILKLALNTCILVAKESRAGVCHFGELILPTVLKIFKVKGGDETLSRKLAVDFLLLQVQCHHPNGVKQGSGAAYACEWNKWTRNMHVMYRIVIDTISRSERNRHNNLSESFLNFSVELFNQLLDTTKPAYDMSITMNETEDIDGGPAVKRRKWMTSTEELFEELQSCRRDSSGWPVLVLAILKKYPNLFQNVDLLQLLQIMSEIQSNWQNQETLKYVNMCCEQLVKVLSQRRLSSDIFLKVWDTSLRSISSAQSEIHPLLQTLISEKSAPTSGLQALVRMFQRRIIQLSDASIKTLSILLSHYHIPESSGSMEYSSDPWDIPISSSRVVLLDWLFSYDADTVLDPKLIANVLVTLILRVRNKPACPQTISASSIDGTVKDMSFEENYCVSVFEDGLLLCPNPNQEDTRKTLHRNSNRISDCVVDLVSKDKLENLMRKKYLEIERKMSELPEESSLTTTMAAMKLREQKTVLALETISYSTLVVNVLSNLLKFSVVTNDTLKEFSIYELLTKSMRHVSVLLPEVMKEYDSSGKQFINVIKVLQYLKALYGSDLMPCLNKHLCDVTEKSILMSLVSPLYANENKNLDFMNNEAEMVLVLPENMLNGCNFTNTDNFEFFCVEILTLFSCLKLDGDLQHKKQISVTQRIISILSDDSRDLSRESTFILVYKTLSSLLSCAYLELDKHLQPIIHILLSICKKWKHDAEASSYIMHLLRGVFKHAAIDDRKWARKSCLGLLAPFRSKTFGPKFTIQYISCCYELLKIDKEAKWARWSTPLNLCDVLESDTIPDKALRKFEDNNNTTAVVEEILYHLLSPFHEVRLVAVSIVSSLFCGQYHNHNSLWVETMFERLTLILYELFIEKGDDMNREEVMDEGANRTSTVLHVLASILATSSKCQLWSLRLIFRLMKNKNLDQDLIKKVFKSLAMSMKLSNIQGFLEKSLPFILNEWLQWGYQLQDFPFSLLNSSSFIDFFNKYQGKILPVILKRTPGSPLPVLNTIGQIVECSSTHLLEKSFPPVYAQYLGFLVKERSTTETKSACKQHESFFSLVDSEKIGKLVSTQIDEILFEITSLVWDPSHHENVLGLDQNTIQPMTPFISSEEYSAAFKHLQRTLKTEQDLLIHVVDQQPDIVQKVLLQLREDISTSITVNQKVKGLHNYSVFVHAIALCLGRGDLTSIDKFLLSDITHTLLYVIQENKSNPVMIDMCIGSCCFLHNLYHHLLPGCAPIFINLLPTIIGCLIPLAVGSGALAENSLKLLKLLIITHSSCLGDAIGSLPPFPESTEFVEMRKVHSEMKYKGNHFTLKEEIEHFLSSSSASNTLANQNSMFDGLYFLRKELCVKKTELLFLYQELKQGRGFSQDCKESILHQLICKLINITSSANEKVQMEALRCLGELGPTDLTTLVLKPVEGCINLISEYSDPMMCVLALAAQILSEYLLDHNIKVVKSASQTLLNLMSCQKSNALHSSKSNSKQCIDSKDISPFIPKKPLKPFPSLSSDTTKLASLLSDDEIWFPSGGMEHERWISQLSSSLFCSLSDDEVFKDFASLCEVKTSFAEEMLPVLFFLGLSYSSEMGRQLCARLAQFFKNQSSVVCSAKNSILEPDDKNVLLSKPSVQCMLNVINFVRLKKNGESKKDIILKVNYLHVASAAQYCSAYLSSIMFLELWCNGEDRHLDYDGSGIPYIDFFSECEPSNGKVLQNLLLKAYEQIGDNDAMYGCGSSILLDPRARVTEYQLAGMWDKVLLNFDAKLTCSKDKSNVKGLVDALHSSRLYHMLNIFVEAQPSEQKDEFVSAQLECMWRLGQWNTPLSSDTKMKSFERSQYSALQAVSDKNTSRVHESITEGRLCVLENLAHSSLENCKNIYKPMTQLQILKEIEDFVNTDDLLVVWNKWKNQDTLPHSDIFLLETIRAQRATLLQIAFKQENNQSRDIELSSCILQCLTDHYLDTADLARKEGQIQIAEQWLRSLSSIPNVCEEGTRKLRLQEAELAWSSVKGLRDGTNLVARNLLRSLIKDVQAAEKESRIRSKLHPQALILYGKWMAETRSENPQQIIEDYLDEALQLLKDLPSHSSVKEQLEAHSCLAHFADLEYQRITAYIKSETFQKKVKCMEVLRNESSLRVEKGNREQSSAVNFNRNYSALDENEIKNTYKDQDQFLELAMRHYLSSMKLGEGTNLPVFRMVSLWLENSNKHVLNETVNSELDFIQTYKFIELLPQIAARLGQDNNEVLFSKAIYKLLMRCCIEHPYHTLPLILALANSYEDFEGKTKPEPEPRVVAATQMVEELRRNKSVNKLVGEMDKLSKALVSLAYAPVAENARGYLSVAKNEKIKQMQNLQYAMLPIVHLPVQSDAKYNNIISIHTFDNKYIIAGGINKPKKILCVGTDGIKRPLLVKGRDDLRQDAVMQQVFSIVNTLLQACPETKRHRLKIRTYKIVPLSQRCGVLEWCENTSPAQEILTDVHARYYPADYKLAKCMKNVENCRLKSAGEKLHVFKDVCQNLHPALRFFFTEKYTTPAEWFDHRLNYVHSVATNSMVGYILGLGDRHPNNILIDKSTGELIHIDFGIAFEQGKVLPTPETIPFRLTRDIVDGMGISGVEGVFRRSCEKTMAVLRQNQEKILTILEVLLYDPLYQWTITPKLAAKCQKVNSQESVASESDDKENTSQKNKMAERALCRLKEKLQGTEEGPASSIEGQVNRLIQQARDLGNLSKVFKGWQAYL